MSAIQYYHMRLWEYLLVHPLPFKADPVVLDELLKFLSIRAEVDWAKTNNFSIGMRSGPVDELWHTWLMWTANYMWTCHHAFGFIVHHAPLGECDRTEWFMRHARFRGTYRREFGPVPPVWGSWDSIVAEHRAMK